MKVAFTGKGGVGKTTLAGLFAQVLSKDGKAVLAVDCDPDSNLARALDFKGTKDIKPIVGMKDLIEERMGITKGDKSFFKLNPKIDDIPDKFSSAKGNIKLIVMGAIDEGGEGCMCPESTFLKNLLGHLILKRDEHLVMDMEAGVEHLGRATAKSCDFVLTVVEPSVNSIGTAKKIKQFAKDLGIKKIYAVGNKTRTAKDKEFINKELGDIKLIETIDFDEGFLKQDKADSFSLVDNATVKKMEKIKEFLKGDIS